MRAVDLDAVDPKPGSALRCGGETFADALEPVTVEAERRIVGALEWHRGWRDRLPAVRMIGRDLLSAQPRLLGGRLAARMCQLHGDRHIRPPADGVEDAAHRRFGPVVPQANIA